MAHPGVRAPVAGVGAAHAAHAHTHAHAGHRWDQHYSHITKFHTRLLPILFSYKSIAHTFHKRISKYSNLYKVYNKYLGII